MQEPVAASTTQVQAEISAITYAASELCAVRAVLDSVVITRRGTVLALWQPAQGSTDPSELRNRLKIALPGASKRQIVTDTALLHTTLARVAVTPSDIGRIEEKLERNANPEALWSAATALTQEFCGLQTDMNVLWYVEEQDMLALALNGELKRQIIPLNTEKCSGTNKFNF